MVAGYNVLELHFSYSFILKLAAGNAMLLLKRKRRAPILPEDKLFVPGTTNVTKKYLSLTEKQISEINE